MKILLPLLGLLIITLFSSSLLAQVSEDERPASLDNEKNRKHLIKTNLLSALTKSASLGYEQAITNKLSLQPSVYYSKSKMLGQTEKLSVTLDLRKYLSREETVLVGMYIAPYLKYQDLIFREEDYKGDLVAKAYFYTLGGGLLLGRQWIAKRGFTVDIFAGAGYNPVLHVNKLQLTDSSGNYIFPRKKWQKDLRLGVSVGFAF